MEENAEQGSDESNKFVLEADELDLSEEDKQHMEQMKYMAELERKASEYDVMKKMMLGFKHKLTSMEQNMKNLTIELERKDRAIESIELAGINIEDVEPIPKCEKFLNLREGEAEIILERDPEEFLKLICRQYNTLIKEKQIAFETAELDPSGKSIAENMHEAIGFFYKNPTYQSLSSADPNDYEKNQQKLLQAEEDLLKWRTLFVDSANIEGAFANLTIHYAYKRVLKNLNKKKQFIVNPPEEMKKIEEKKQEVKQIEEEKETLKIEVQELKAQNSSILEKLASIGDKLFGEAEVPIKAEEADEAKKKKR